MVINPYDPFGESSVSSCGTGWNKFVEDNHVGDGDLLLFGEVDESTLIVTVNCAPPEVKTTPLPLEATIHPAQSEPGSVVDSPRTPRPPKPPRASGNAPYFEKILRASHTKPGKAARLDIPTAFGKSMVNIYLTE
ncbi:hypothetical protein KC19_VG266200 [Ceratodon purpureus]|uniref:TF-B3 domain-containing protein n=1 Tax=Ceratodon purpureus TaxID=3225 RepID=A0A8T0HUH8_CERPU|nr:hypothetical protein KC19_VG266200 [Ceratodon purpureus]